MTTTRRDPALPSIQHLKKTIAGHEANYQRSENDQGALPWRAPWTPVNEKASLALEVFGQHVDTAFASHEPPDVFCEHVCGLLNPFNPYTHARTHLGSPLMSPRVRRGTLQDIEVSNTRFPPPQC